VFLETDMGPYEERTMDAASTRDALWKRPAMLLGSMEDGAAFACIVRQLVEATLSWQIGSNLALQLTPGNGVELRCYSDLPQGEKAYEHRWSRPLHVVTDRFAILGAGRYATQILALACRQMKWEIRDRFGAGSAVFEEGLCRHAAHVAPDLPAHLCLRVSLVIGTSRLVIAPTTIDQVARAIRYMSGPAEAGYWGCVSISDTRTGESRAVLVTDWPQTPA
jgi:hypothetical protein